MRSLCLADVREQMDAWDVTPPQAVSLHWLRNMIAGYFGIDTGDGPQPEPIPVTPAVIGWMHEQLAGMRGGMSQEVFQALQRMEADCG